MYNELNTYNELFCSLCCSTLYCKMLVISRYNMITLFTMFLTNLYDDLNTNFYNSKQQQTKDIINKQAIFLRRRLRIMQYDGASYIPMYIVYIR